jgi:hypothetical protein
MRMYFRLAFLALLLGASLSSAACARVEEPATSDAEPADVQSISGSDLNRVVITEEASRSLGIQTGLVIAGPRAAVSAGPSATPKKRIPAKPTSVSIVAPAMTIVPTTAIVYDPVGACWVYTSPKARTFVRAQIVIDHASGAAAYLSSGPPVGTVVVTTGASELLGAEYGVGGE